MKSSALQDANRRHMVLKHVGQLSLALGALTPVPLSISLSFGDLDIGLRSALVIGVVVVLGATLSRLQI
ncbi:MAG: hypothetical protein WD425_07600 [Nitrospirales bacterium]